VLLIGAILLAIFVLPSPWGIVAVVAGGLIDVAETAALWYWSRRRRAVTGAEALVGQKAVVASPLRPVGQVRVAGELWAARSESGADVGDEVIVRTVDGLTLLVD
jgi:membrane protein implicated in regulation of membrane protease activity